MFSVNDWYLIIQLALNKNQDGDITPDQFNLLAHQCQLSFCDFLLGQMQQYQPSRPQPRIQYSENRTIRQKLTPLIYGYLLNVDSNGFSPYPSDYQETDAMWSYYGFNNFKFVRQDALRSYYNSKIDPIATNPIYLIKDKGFQFYPANVGHSNLSYVRTPPRIYWAYTLDANGRPVYDPINSEQPVWNQVDALDIIGRMLRLMGVNLQASVVSQYANEIKSGGQ